MAHNLHMWYLNIYDVDPDGLGGWLQLSGNLANGRFVQGRVRLVMPEVSTGRVVRTFGPGGKPEDDVMYRLRNMDRFFDDHSVRRARQYEMLESAAI